MLYKIAFTPIAAEDMTFWQRTSQKTVNKIKRMLHEMQAHPFTGIGKPEPLKYQFAGAGPDGSTTRTAWSIKSKVTS